MIDEKSANHKSRFQQLNLETFTKNIKKTLDYVSVPRSRDILFCSINLQFDLCVFFTYQDMLCLISSLFLHSVIFCVQFCAIFIITIFSSTYYTLSTLRWGWCFDSRITLKFIMRMINSCHVYNNILFHDHYMSFQFVLCYVTLFPLILLTFISFF